MSELKILVDTHCHSIASTHAYSTIQEMAFAAAAKGLEMIAITDHGSSMDDGPHLWHFTNYTVIPRDICGIKILTGVESNIIDRDGTVDIPDSILKDLDIVIASFHTPCLKPGTTRQNTDTWKRVLDNPYVDIMGHSGNGQYPFEHDEVLRHAKKNDKAVEINNHSFAIRKGSNENCKLIALKCKELGVKIVVSSDAHIGVDVGRFERSLALLREIDMPEQLIMNTSAEKLQNWLTSRRNIN